MPYKRIPSCAAGLVAVCIIAWLGCESTTGEDPRETSAIAGTWVQQDGGVTHTLVLMDYPADFSSVDAAGDTLKGWSGTHVVDSSVSPAHVDFSVSYVYGRGSIPYTA
ncbi:MAG: hypothetical protein GF331_03180, partial [Chitinivibrionales bacterium]|nr:hypothetical protein [Chitinivibrionales bacterium]